MSGGEGNLDLHRNILLSGHGMQLCCHWSIKGSAAGVRRGKKNPGVSCVMLLCMCWQDACVDALLRSLGEPCIDAGAET